MHAQYDWPEILDNPDIPTWADLAEYDSDEITFTYFDPYTGDTYSHCSVRVRGSFQPTGGRQTVPLGAGNQLSFLRLPNGAIGFRDRQGGEGMPAVVVEVAEA